MAKGKGCLSWQGDLGAAGDSRMETNSFARIKTPFQHRILLGQGHNGDHPCAVRSRVTRIQKWIEKWAELN